jgi:hypothetical protein
VIEQTIVRGEKKVPTVGGGGRWEETQYVDPRNSAWRGLESRGAMTPFLKNVGTRGCLEKRRDPS